MGITPLGSNRLVRKASLIRMQNTSRRKVPKGAGQVLGATAGDVRMKNELEKKYGPEQVRDEFVLMRPVTPRSAPIDRMMVASDWVGEW